MYALITQEELKTLSQAKCSAALPVYLAAKMRAFGAKTSSYPTRKTINNDLGGRYALITITKAISELVKLGMVERIHDTIQNIWFFIFPEKEKTFGKKGIPKRRAPYSNSKSPIKNKTKDTSINNKIMKSQSPDEAKSNKSHTNPVKNWLHFAINKVFGLGNKPVPNPGCLKNQILDEIQNNDMYDDWKEPLKKIITEKLYDESLDFKIDEPGF
tara:strand:+ start:110 stop:751 length:642 start_codon:yes stop_codon:yes gene_type:complete